MMILSGRRGKLAREAVACRRRGRIRISDRLGAFLPNSISGATGGVLLSPEIRVAEYPAIFSRAVCGPSGFPGPPPGPELARDRRTISHQPSSHSSLQTGAPLSSLVVQYGQRFSDALEVASILPPRRFHAPEHAATPASPPSTAISLGRQAWRTRIAQAFCNRKLAHFAYCRAARCRLKLLTQAKGVI
jgi:hypothetical protein